MSVYIHFYILQLHKNDLFFSNTAFLLGSTVKSRNNGPKTITIFILRKINLFPNIF